ncbi:MAG TPA: DUF4340 domain-containing protein [Anaerolineae bacterium]|nr:DUF4340 domain-containing protein [Anaerolineae bacterium]
MKLVKSLITLLVVIIIGILVYFKVYKVEELRKISEAHERQLIRFDLDKIKSFTLVRPDSSLVFERGTGRIWNITSPVISEADKDPLFTLFNSLNKSDIIFNVAENPENLNIYGLSKPDFYMAMSYDDIDPDTLFVGSDTPDRTMTYVRFASEDRVLAISNSLTDLMKRPVRFYRSRTILNVLASDITNIEIIRSNKEENQEESRIVLNFNDVTWMMTYPWKHPADIRNVEEITKKIEDAGKMQLVVEKTDDLTKYGLDKPNYIVNVSLKYGMPGKMLLIGDNLTELGQKHLWYAKKFDNDLVFMVERSLINLLNGTLTWYIDKQPAQFNRYIVNKIIMNTNENPITFVKDTSDNWSAISPVDKNVDRQTIDSIYSISRYLLVQTLYAYEPTPKDLAETGLDKPRITLSFYQDDRLLTQVYYGNSFTTDKQNTYVKTSMSPIIYISGAQINSIINRVLEQVFGS